MYKHKKASADGKGFVTLHYSELKNVEDHLQREHDFGGQCEAIQILRALWTLGCAKANAEWEKKQGS